MTSDAHFSEMSGKLIQKLINEELCRKRRFWSKKKPHQQKKLLAFAKSYLIDYEMVTGNSFADSNRLRTVMPTTAARTALMIPTRIKGVTPAVMAADQLSSAAIFNQMTPKVKVMHMPMMFAMMAFLTVNPNFSKSQPMNNAVKINPIINPPVGPTKTPIPDDIPLKTGTPMIPSMI